MSLFQISDGKAEVLLRCGHANESHPGQPPLK